jgi:hypothetical protein
LTDLVVYAASVVLAAALTYVVAPLLSPPRPLAELGSGSVEALADLARRRSMVYQSIRDAELDRQTGKLSEEDFEGLVRVLKSDALRLLREEDRLRDGVTGAGSQPAA